MHMRRTLKVSPGDLDRAMACNAPLRDQRSAVVCPTQHRRRSRTRPFPWGSCSSPTERFHSRDDRWQRSVAGFSSVRHRIATTRRPSIRHNPELVCGLPAPRRAKAATPRSSIARRRKPTSRAARSAARTRRYAEPAARPREGAMRCRCSGSRPKTVSGSRICGLRRPTGRSETVSRAAGTRRGDRPT